MSLNSEVADLNITKKKRGRPQTKKLAPQSDKTWSDDEIDALLHYLEENFNKWAKGKKIQFYAGVVAARILPGREELQIKNKLGKLRDKYLQEKDSVNTTGAAPSTWKWFHKMD